MFVRNVDKQIPNFMMPYPTKENNDNESELITLERHYSFISVSSEEVFHSFTNGSTALC
jgi:hypothetical protein